MLVVVVHVVVAVQDSCIWLRCDMIPFTTCMCVGRRSDERNWHGILPSSSSEEPHSHLPHIARRGGISFDRADKNALYVRMLADVKSKPKPEPCKDRKHSSIVDIEQTILDTLTLKEYKTRCRPRLLSLHSKHRKHRPVSLKVSRDNESLLDNNYSGQAKCLLSTIGDWDFNIFNLDKLTNGRPLFHVALHLFQKHNLIEAFNLDILKLMRCISLIEDGYHGNNPYHNSVHAADVTQSMHCYLMENKFASCVTPLEVMVALLSAMTHDLDHPGVNQAFLIATKNPLASLYKNASVLENHHWRSAIGVLHESGVFSHLDSQQWNSIECQLRSLILATDITRQQEFLTRLKDHLDKDEIDLQNQEQRHFLLQIGLKCADICNPCRPWEISKQWSQRVCDEFYQQGDYERKLGLKVTALFDRNVTSVAEIQAGFIQFVVRPLFTEWHRFNSTTLSEEMLGHINHNFSEWQKAIQEQKEKEKENDYPKDALNNNKETEENSQMQNVEPKESSTEDLSKADNSSIHVEDSQEKELKELSPVSEEVVDFPGFNLRRHSLPPNMLLADTSYLIYSKQENFPQVEYSRRHSLPRNIYKSTSFDRLVEKLASVSEDPQNNRDFSFQRMKAKPKITTLSPSIETSRITSAYQNFDQEHLGGPQRYTITCTTITRHRAGDENAEITPRTVIISTKVPPRRAHVPATSQTVDANPSTFQNKPVLTSLPQNGSLCEKHVWGSSSSSCSGGNTGNFIKSMDVNTVIPAVLTQTVDPALKDIRTSSPSERPKSLFGRSAGQHIHGNGSHDRKIISGKPGET